MSQWYAVRTATRREFTALGGLVDREYAVFMPMKRVWSVLTRPGQKVAIDRPLLPGYLFVLCSPEDWRSIKPTDGRGGIEGVSGFVTAVGPDGIARPIAFPLDAVVGLQADERAGVYDYTRAERVKYQPKKGDRVQVKAGPWLAFIGRVLDTPRGERAHVMLEGPGGRGVALPNEYLQLAAS